MKNVVPVEQSRELPGLFEKQFRQALNHYRNPEWLGTHSPLARPYFLGKLLTTGGSATGKTAVLRGQILQRLLYNVATAPLASAPPITQAGLMECVQAERAIMGSRSPAYQLLLLDLKYFRRFFPSNVYPLAKQETDIREFLGVGRGPFFKHLKDARQRLGEHLLEQLQPALRLEQPPEPHGTLLGQQRHATEALAHLQNKTAVFITGPGGCGKTSLAATIARNWPKTAVFWFTFWPNRNDHLDSLLFSLGHFLKQQGATTLWQQLITSEGHINNSNIALAYLRTDLAQLSTPPLLCFDEIDYLLRDASQRSVTAEELFIFLERLHGLAPMLFIGQQVGLQADYYLTLHGLNVAELAQLAEEQGVTLTEKQQNKLFAITGGNPRLLKLCLPLLRDQKVRLRDLPQSASISGLFSSLWRSMPPHEQALAQQLAVFRSPAPNDAWIAYQNGLQLLDGHALLQRDAQGGVQLLPIFSGLIRSGEYMSADRLEQCHLAAASIRVARGEYTSGVYHLLSAGEPEQAIQLWTTYSRQEIGRGQGSIAYQLLQTIPLRRLMSDSQQALALALGELCDLLGAPQAGLQAIELARWSTGPYAIDALTLKGKFLNALGEHEAAIDSFAESLEQIGQLRLKEVHLHTWHGVSHMQQRDLKTALRSAQQAQYEAAFFYGQVREQRGEYEAARLAYEQALAAANEIAFSAGVAKANRGLASLLVRQGKEEEALGCAETAVHHFEQLGDLFNVEKARNIIIAIHFNQGRFADVIRLGEASLAFFETAAMPYWASITAATLSEAYLEHGDDIAAEAKARQTITFEQPQSLPYAYYTLGLIAKKRQDLPTAQTFLQQALAFAQQTDDCYLRAYVERALGEAYGQEGDGKTAVFHLQQAKTLFESLGNISEATTTETHLVQLTA
ncbi:MAG: tetratricopeptide repeat protein [Chloroflexota bacterium]